MKAILILLFITPQFIFSQSNKLEIFENLMDRNWKAEGKWGDGSTFKQEITFKYSLDSNIIVTNSKGIIDKEHNLYGDRNHGIRKYDPALNQILFWEFDIFGGTTQGTVTTLDKSILYQYQYGESFVSEIWEYINDSTYNFRVGNYKDGQWSQVYLDAQFKGTKIYDIEDMYTVLKNKLNGNWSSVAWDGVLNESWTIDKNGHIAQSAQYIENEKVLYEAVNKIELVDNQIILFSVIKDNNPKIFKASSYSEESIIFENSDYKNPNKVIYSFITKNEFHRNISGIENNEPTNYTFKFKKVE